MTDEATTLRRAPGYRPPIVDWSRIPLARQRPLSYWVRRYPDTARMLGLGHTTGTARQRPIENQDVLDRAADRESTAPASRHGGGGHHGGAPRRWTPPPTAPRRLLSLEETAAYLGLSPWSVRGLQWKGHLPRVRISRRLLFDRADVDRLIERQKDPPWTP